MRGCVFSNEDLAGIGKKKAPSPKPLVEQLAAWSTQIGLSTMLSEYYRPLIQVIGKGEIDGFDVDNGVLSVDLDKVFGLEHEPSEIGAYLLKHVMVEQTIEQVEEVAPTPVVVQKQEPTVVETVAPVQKPTSQPIQEKQTNVVRMEKQLAEKIVVLKDVQKKTGGKSSKRRQVTTEDQLVFDLFA